MCQIAGRVLRPTLSKQPFFLPSNQLLIRLYMETLTLGASAVSGHVNKRRQGCFACSNFELAKNSNFQLAWSGLSNWRKRLRTKTRKEIRPNEIRVAKPINGYR